LFIGVAFRVLRRDTPTQYRPMAILEKRHARLGHAPVSISHEIANHRW
jgi:hypothetical protein